MANRTYLATVRFKDGKKQKLKVVDVPDCVATVHKLVTDELISYGKAVRVVLLRVDSIPHVEPF